jgi:hypothetical protein
VSRGGFVSRIAMELRPDVFVGAVMSAGGGAGEIAVHNAKLDGLWTLKQLAGVPLTLVGFATREEAMAENARIQAAVKELRGTPTGRARLALAAAFEQFPTWTEGDEPPAPTDYEAQLDQIANAFAFANPAQVRQGVEVIAGGNFSWNDGVDYADLLARSGMAPLVNALYAKAGADLAADLRTLAAAPRISASPAAVAAAEKTTSYAGRISGPVIVVDNIGDPVDAAAYKRAYERTVTRAGNGELLRTTWVRSARHANQSALERIAGFVTLIERLDGGRWPATTPEAMNARAADIRRNSAIDLGPARFISHDAPDALRPWDGFNWGTYAGAASQQPAVGGERAPSTRAQVAEWMKTASAWGKWGADDQLGALNYITPARRRAAAALVRTGEVVSLSRPITLQPRHAEIAADGKPNGLPFYEMTFRTFPKGDPRGNEDFTSDVQAFAPHGALLTHLDALCHYSSETGQLYNGYKRDEVVSQDRGCTKLGLDSLKDGIVTRGILIDMTRLKAPRAAAGRVFAEDIEAFERQAGIRIGEGDALFVYDPRPAGQRGGIDVSAVVWMAQRGVALTSGIARVPDDPHGDHRVPLVAAGIFLLDSPDLSRLAETAARLNRWEFMLTLAPPLAPGASGYPVNPLALF